MKNELTVVIADDHPLFRRGLREAIDGEPGVRVVGEAQDGVAALSLVEQQRAALVILDIDMPRMGGIAVAQEIRRRALDTGVIFLTMYSEEDLFNAAMDAGARAYVLKDSAVTEVRTAIERVAAGRYYISPALTDHLIRRGSRAEALLRHAPSLEDLTPAEIRILKLVAQNRTSKEIADLLSISYKTVENHRGHIASKLQLRGSHALLKFALENRELLARD